MNTFELEQKLQKEHGDINIIKISNNNAFITTLIGRSCYSEIVKKERVIYPSKTDLYKNSIQFEKYKNLPTIEVTMSGTDAKNWIINRL